MANIIDICNQALAQVGEGKIESLAQPGEVARVINLHVKDVVRAVLEAHPWVCAKYPATLSQVPTPPTNAWAYGYTLPVDYIRMVEFNNQGVFDTANELYEVQGNYLLTDESTAQVVYVRDLFYDTDRITLMTPLLVKVLVYSLAAAIAPSFSKSRSDAFQLQQMADEFMKRAKSKEVAEQNLPVKSTGGDSNWITSRYRV